MNQIIHTLPFAASTDSEPNTVQQTDFSPPEPTPVDSLAEEISELRRHIESLSLQNESLKQLIDSLYPSPRQKRKLLNRLERKFKLSRRHACRLISFARSTCWYRKASAQIEPDAPQTPISELDRTELVKRMGRLCRRVDNASIPIDRNLQAQFEYGLQRLGLVRAALISRTNLRLAMDIFKAWNTSRQLKRQPNSSTASS